MGDRQKTKNVDSSEIDDSVPFLNVDELSTQSIHLENLLTKELTSSGSFDIRGQIWKTTFGKLLQALPIPTLLLDQSYSLVATNQAFERIPHRHIEGSEFHFGYLFPDMSAVRNILSIVKEVFATRKPQVAEAVLGHGQVKIWSRMTFRSVRIGAERFVLVILEDLTAEKKMISLKEKEDQELRRINDGLEKRVEERTVELLQANEALRMLIEGIQRKITDERHMATRNLRILVSPLLNKLISDPSPPYHVRSIAEALKIALDKVFSSYRSDVAKVFPSLTPKEMEVAELLVSGLSTKEISSIMGTAVESINFHRHNIRKKLGIVRTDEHLASWLKNRLERHSSSDWD